MADPPNIETHIDCFLEQFKKSASKVMEEHNITVSPVVPRSRSFYLEVETPGEFIEKCPSVVFLHLRSAVVTTFGVKRVYVHRKRNYRMKRYITVIPSGKLQTLFLNNCGAT